MDMKDTVKLWLDRANGAAKAKEEWEKEFRVGDCKSYYLGKQYADPLDLAGERKIIVNKVGAHVRSTIPSLVFRYPNVRIVGTPEIADTPGTELAKKTKLLEDTLNSIIRDPNTQFNENIYPALKEAFWAFGVVETGYSADFSDAPTAPKPALNEDENDEIEAPLPKVDSESFFVKHIPAKTFVISNDATSVVSDASWLGYYEYMFVEDVKKAPAYKGHTKGLKASGVDEKGEECKEQESKVKVWKIWDQRQKKKIVLADGHDQILLNEDYDHLPLHFLRFENQTDKFYPVPPIFSSLGSQDEYNDSREMLRKLRKAIVPRYTYDEQAMDPEDLEKFETGDIGVYIAVRNQNPSPINPVNQPSFADGAIRTLTLAGQEFNETAGSSAQSRQVKEDTTATEAKIINQKEQVADSFDRQTVAIFLASVASGLLRCAIKFMILDHWVARNSDQFSPMFQQDAQQIASIHQQITFEDLQQANAAMRWQVQVVMESLGPASEQEKRQIWNSALQMLANAPIARLLATSPELLQHTLSLNGIESSQEQRLIGEALGKIAQMEMAMAQQQGKMPSQAGVAGQAAPQQPGQPGVPPQGPPQAPPQGVA